MKKLLLLLVLASSVLLAACGPGVPEDEPAMTTTPAGETAVPPTPESYPAQETIPTPPSDTGYPSQNEPAVVTDTAYPAQVDLTTLTPQAGDGTPQVAPQPGVPGGEQPVGELVIADLAQRLALETSAIEIVSQEEVDWSDSALGCPAPDMNYLQVITPGFKIVLQANGSTYDYHTDTRGFFVLCGPKGQPVP